MTAVLPRNLVLPQPRVRRDERALVERLAARVACCVDEVAVFGSRAEALDALSRRVLKGQHIAVAAGTDQPLAAEAWRAARVAIEVPVRPIEALVQGARDADVLVLTSPVAHGSAATILPRELMLLRSRAPKPMILLDLLREEQARTPLTQPALLLPDTLIVRGFGPAWRACGAGCLSDLVFVVGPSTCIQQFDAPLLPHALIESACNDLDRSDLERCVRHAASTLHTDDS